MKFILRKYVEAKSPAEALKLDKKTPVHDVYLREGQEPTTAEPKDLIGFCHPEEPTFGWSDEANKGKR